MSGIGAPELLILLVVILVLFGSTKLPKLARSVGQASKEFKKGVAEGANDADGEAKAKAKADADEKVTMTKAELDAMIEREAKARKENPSA